MNRTKLTHVILYPKANYMAIIEWKGKSRMGGVLGGDLTLPSLADKKIYDNFVKSLQNGNLFYFIFLFPFILFCGEPYVRD